MAKSRSSGISKHIEYMLARGLIGFLQRLPLGFAYQLGRAVGWLCWKLLKSRRKVVRRNLEVIHAWMAAEREEAYERLNIDEQVREVFLCNAINLFCGFSLSGMSTEQLEQHIELVGVELLQAAGAEGCGAILLLAHMGPWEALAHLPELLEKHGAYVSWASMYRPFNDARFDDWYRSVREQRGTKMFSRKDGFHKPIDFIRSNGVLGILSDQKMREGERVPFFGVEVPTSPIAGLFYRRSGAPIVSLCFETVGPKQWRMSFRKVDCSGLPEKASRADLACLCNQALEQNLSASIADGFWFHRRFK